MKTNPSQHFFGKVLTKGEPFQRKGMNVLVITLGEELPNKVNKVQFEVFNHVIQQFENIKEKDVIKIAYNIVGNEWNGKIFTNLHVTGVEVLEEYKANLFENMELPDNDDLFNDFNH